MDSIITIDLGAGDTGKGSIVDFLCRRWMPNLVIRYSGGSQCGHNVQVGNKHHTFAQLGAGTMAGVDTFLSRYMLVNPLTLSIESEELRKKGFPGSLDKVYIDERALVTTPYHRALNRLKELSRGMNRHGSCGKGVGETVAFTLKYPSMTISISDLKKESVLVNKLDFIRTTLGKEASALPFIIPNEEIIRQQSTFHPSTINEIYNQYKEFVQCVHILDKKEAGHLLTDCSFAIFEGAQGVLLDENFGFHPYTTWSTTTSKNAHKILAEFNIQGNRTEIGILRIYATRHGPGPFPTEASLGIEDKNNPFNPWQREFRVGWLDLPLLRYALTVNGPVDMFAVTHIDTLKSVPEWKVCTQYSLEGKEFLPKWKDILEEQAGLTEQMFKVEPQYEIFNQEQVLDLIKEKLKTPIGIQSFGPDAKDKICT